MYQKVISGSLQVIGSQVMLKYLFIIFQFLSFLDILLQQGSPDGASGKEPDCQCRRPTRGRLEPWVGKIPWRRAWQPTPGFSPGKSQGQKSLEDPSSQYHKETDMTEHTRAHTHTHTHIQWLPMFGMGEGITPVTVMDEQICK